MGDTTKLQIADLGELFDGPHATPTRVNEGPYFLNISSLQAGRLNLDASDHVTEDDFKKWTRRVTPEAGDLLFSYETRLGEAALMPEGVRACLGRRMALLRPNRDVIDPRFLLYYYLGPDFQRTIAANTIHGATVSRIGLTEMPSWSVEVPSLPKQRAIAEVLGALDDKIAANTRVIALAEQTSSTLWKSNLLDGTEVPLSTLARFVNGRAYTKNASGNGRLVVRIAELNSGPSASTVYNDVEVPEDNLARPGDLLFSWSGSLTVARWYRPEAIVNQHIFKVIPDQGYPIWFVNQALRGKLADFQAIAADKATTMGHIQRRHLDEMVTIPTEEAVRDLAPKMDSFWRLGLTAELENEALAATRDQLLPLLMSGKITVKQAEDQVADVL